MFSASAPSNAVSAEGRLSDWVKRKTVQKACESRKISPAQKNELRAWLEQEEEAEAVRERMWNTILFLKEADVFPGDRQVSFSVMVYSGDERKKRYSVENIWEIEGENGLDWKCKEHIYETG